MKNLNFPEIEKIFMCSDIHGEYGHLLNNIQYRSNPNINETKKEEDSETQKIKLSYRALKKREIQPIYNNSLIIVCGDCGFGFNKIGYYESTLESLNDWLNSINSNLVFFRGNHDDPSYFKEEKLKFSNITLIDDYTIISTKEHNILCVGGGLSIDKSWRLTREEQINRFKVNEKSFKKLYWKDENFVFDEVKIKEIKDSGIEVDIVATHIAPNLKKICCDNANIKYWLRCNDGLKLDIETEKNTMKQFQGFIFKNFDIKVWFSGHLHINNSFKDKKSIFYQLPSETNTDELTNLDDVISSFNKKEETKQSKGGSFKIPPLETFAYDYEKYVSSTYTTINNSLLDELLRTSVAKSIEKNPLEIRFVEENDSENTPSF